MSVVGAERTLQENGSRRTCKQVVKQAGSQQGGRRWVLKGYGLACAGGALWV